MTDQNLKYKPLDILTDSEISETLSNGSIESIIMLPLSVGLNHPNWKFAQSICIQLYAHSDWRVKANALQGLEYIARSKGKLEKHLVKPILLDALRSSIHEDLDSQNIVATINRLLKWKIGSKHQTT
jgi:hypothetical protein